MRYLELHRQFRDHTVFSIQDIRKLDPEFRTRRLVEWQEKGYIRKVIRGYYIFTTLELNEERLYEIANRIYSPSYISLQSALAHYGFIPESPYRITSVTTLKTKSFDTDLAGLHYRTMRPDYFRGYSLATYAGGVYKIGEPAKVVLDMLYLTPALRDENDFAELRFNRDVWDAMISARRIRHWLGIFNKQFLTERAYSLMEYMKHA